MTLYHYTSAVAAEQIGELGVVVPLVVHHPAVAARMRNGPYWWTTSVSWFTDLDVPHKEALGLTSLTVVTDRTERRYLVLDETQVHRWVRVGRVIVPSRQVELLNSAPGALPMHWWVSFVDVPVRLDRRYARDA